MAKKRILALLGIAVVAAIGILVAGRIGEHRLDLKSCFDDVQGLKSGAAVRLAGVDVGRVRSVRAEPQNKNCPAEVEMTLHTSYELPVPQDALTEIKTAGVLGESYVTIDARAASRPPVENYGYLKSKPTLPEPSVGEIVKAVSAAAAIMKATDQPATNTPKQPVRKPRP